MYLFKVVAFILICIFILSKKDAIVVNSSYIEIPSLNIKSEYKFGYSDSLLNYGVVADKNSLGTNNLIIFGHRFESGNDFLTPFTQLNRIRQGDLIMVSFKGRVSKYKVDSTLTLDKGDIWVTSQGSEKILTIITCTPIYYPIKRLVVIAKWIE